MPVTYDETIWRALYRDSDGTTYGPDWYNRDTVRMAARAASLANRGTLANANVLVIGCAWGFEVEALLDAGFSNVYGIDPSPYVWADTSGIRPDVLPRLVNATVGVTPTGDIRSALAAAGMSNPQRADWIVDADAVSSQQDDPGIAAFLTGCEELLQGNARGRIIHIVSSLTPERAPGDSAILWKTIDEWRAYAPSHTWLDVRETYQ